MYGHIHKLATEIAAGVKEAGHEATLWQVRHAHSAPTRYLRKAFLNELVQRVSNI